MPGPKEITVSDLRRDLPAILHRVVALNESFVLLKNGQPFARIAPIDDEEVRTRMRSKLREGLHDLVDAEEVLGPQRHVAASP